MHVEDLYEDDLDLSEVADPLLTAKSKQVISGARQRKPKVSTIPTDYDPFMALQTFPEGYSRPKENCWVDRSIARPVDISELSPLWRCDLAEMGTADRKHRFLASVVASVYGEFYVRRKHNGMWVKKKGSEVKNILWNEWGADQTDLNIRIDTINTFMSQSSYVVLDQIIYVPGAGAFVEYQGRKCLNKYHERQLAFPTNAAPSPETTLLVELIVKNLLNHKEGEFFDWIEAIESPEPSPIRWLFHWLASQYQRAGKSLPTAVWFVGPAQGIGKSLFTSGLSLLVGKTNAKVVSAEEFKGDWTDFLTNATLFILDEVDFTSRVGANAKIKRLVGNEKYAIRQRNVGEYEVPAVGNFIFTTNNIYPIALDRDDRRSTFFETNGTYESKKRATDFFNLKEEDRKKAWEGFAEILSMIEIDDRLISRAFETDLKRRIIDSGLDPFDEWFQSDEVRETWKPGEFAPVEWIKARYVEWAEKNAHRNCATSSYGLRKLEAMASEGLVSRKFRKTLSDGRKPHGYTRIDPNAPDYPQTDGNVISIYKHKKTVAATREKILAKSSKRTKTVTDDDW